MNDHVLVQFRLPPGATSVAAAAERLGVDAADLDHGYGVVATDPADRLFAAMVKPGRTEAINAKLGGGDGTEGVFANPPLEEFDPRM